MNMEPTEIPTKILLQFSSTVMVVFKCCQVSSDIKEHRKSHQGQTTKLSKSVNTFSVPSPYYRMVAPDQISAIFASRIEKS